MHPSFKTYLKEIFSLSREHRPALFNELLEDGELAIVKGHVYIGGEPLDTNVAALTDEEMAAQPDAVKAIAYLLTEEFPAPVKSSEAFIKARAHLGYTEGARSQRSKDVEDAACVIARMVLDVIDPEGAVAPTTVAPTPVNDRSASRVLPKLDVETDLLSDDDVELEDPDTLLAPDPLGPLANYKPGDVVRIRTAPRRGGSGRQDIWHHTLAQGSFAIVAGNAKLIEGEPRIKVAGQHTTVDNGRDRITGEVLENWMTASDIEPASLSDLTLDALVEQTAERAKQLLVGDAVRIGKGAAYCVPDEYGIVVEPQMQSTVEVRAITDNRNYKVSNQLVRVEEVTRVTGVTVNDATLAKRLSELQAERAEEVAEAAKKVAEEAERKAAEEAERKAEEAERKAAEEAEKAEAERKAAEEDRKAKEAVQVVEESVQPHKHDKALVKKAAKAFHSENYPKLAKARAEAIGIRRKVSTSEEHVIAVFLREDAKTTDQRLRDNDLPRSFIFSDPDHAWAEDEEITVHYSIISDHYLSDDKSFNDIAKARMAAPIYG